MRACLRQEVVGQLPGHHHPQDRNVFRTLPKTPLTHTHTSLGLFGHEDVQVVHCAIPRGMVHTVHLIWMVALQWWGATALSKTTTQLEGGVRGPSPRVEEWMSTPCIIP